MAENSKIEWTDATWNPVTGCSIVSPGCTNCYAMKLAGTRLKHHPSRAGLTVDSKAGPVWTGEVRLNREWLDQPLTWKRPRRIFVCAHGDLFAEGVPDEWIDRIFAVMALCPQHTFQVLTKRAKRMRAYISECGKQLGRQGELREFVKRYTPHAADRFGDHSETSAAVIRVSGSREAGFWAPLPNVWLGVSAERQLEADERIPELLATPAAVRFVSAEPLLGPIDFTRIDAGDLGRYNALGNGPYDFRQHPSGTSLDWIIVGGESGQDARPMHPAWARAIRDQCAAAQVPFFFKQWGSWLPGEDCIASEMAEDLELRDRYQFFGDCHFVFEGKKRAGRLLDGVEHNGMPAFRLRAWKAEEVGLA